MTAAKIVVLKQHGFLSAEEVDLPQPAGRQIAVEMLAAVIGAAQLRQVQQSDVADWRPMVPGSEGVGRVTACSAAVTRVAPGDLVVIGNDALIDEGEAVPSVAIEAHDGVVEGGRVWTWTTNTLVDERFAAVVPPTLVDRGEALAALGATALGAAASVRAVATGESVAVLGCEGAGLAVIAAAKASGAGRVVAIGALHHEDAARAAGATEFIVGAAFPQETIADHAIDAAAPVPIERQGDFARVSGWIEAGRFPIEAIIGRRYTIEESNEAILDLESDAPAGLALLIFEPLR